MTSIVKDGIEVHTIPGGGRTNLTAEWTDPGFTPGRTNYYARAEFASGKVAFSSPVFVS